MHARQLDGVVQKSGAKDESSRSGTLTFNMSHASERGTAARKKSLLGSRIAESQFVVSLVSCAEARHQLSRLSICVLSYEPPCVDSRLDLVPDDVDARAATWPRPPGTK